MPNIGLGMKVAYQPCLVGNLFDHQAVGHDLVGHGQSIGIAHIDFMLADGHLMMGFIDADAHFFQSQDGLVSEFGSGIAQGHIIIAALIQAFGRGRRSFHPS